MNSIAYQNQTPLAPLAMKRDSGVAESMSELQDCSLPTLGPDIMDKNESDVDSVDPPEEDLVSMGCCDYFSFPDPELDPDSETGALSAEPVRYEQTYAEHVFWLKMQEDNLFWAQPIVAAELERETKAKSTDSVEYDLKYTDNVFWSQPILTLEDIGGLPADGESAWTTAPQFLPAKEKIDEEHEAECLEVEAWEDDEVTIKPKRKTASLGPQYVPNADTEWPTAFNIDEYLEWQAQFEMKPSLKQRVASKMLKLRQRIKKLKQQVRGRWKDMKTAWKFRCNNPEHVMVPVGDGESDD